MLALIAFVFGFPVRPDRTGKPTGRPNKKDRLASLCYAQRLARRKARARLAQRLRTMREM